MVEGGDHELSDQVLVVRSFQSRRDAGRVLSAVREDDDLRLQLPLEGVGQYLVGLLKTCTHGADGGPGP